MHLGHHLVVILLGLGLTVGLAAPATAAEPALTTLTLTAPSRYADTATPLRLQLTASEGAPVAGAQVSVERRVSGEWVPLGVVPTDETGRAVLDATLRRDARDNLFRATYAGDAAYAPSTSGPVAVRLVRRNSQLSVGGPDSVVDEQQTTVRVRWTTGNDDPVSGRVKVFRSDRGGKFVLARTLGTDQDGRAELRVRPRVDTRWRARAAALDWVERGTSDVHSVDNLPPRAPVRLPATAPRPRITLPAQTRAVDIGPNAVISRIPNGIWSQMTGRTWHSGCPVGRTGLRLVRINYWGYDGYRHRGELVASAGAAGQMAGALAQMYHRGYPLRSLYRVDRFGWSAKLRGGNDYDSMNAGNTSGFNCRDVVNKPGVRSPHSYGRSLDVNTWENPYRSRQGLVPNAYWQPRSHPLVAWRSHSHAVVQIMARHGLRWTYGLGDTQHFDAAYANGRIRVHPECTNAVCE